MIGLDEEFEVKGVEQRVSRVMSDMVTSQWGATYLMCPQKASLDRNHHESSETDGHVSLCFMK